MQLTPRNSIKACRDTIRRIPAHVLRVSVIGACALVWAVAVVAMV